MDASLTYLWGKLEKAGEARWHPLPLHFLDVAACAREILAREPESTRARMAQSLGLPWEQAQPWLLLVIACHDLGKASPGFQHKWPMFVSRLGLRPCRSPDLRINHAFVSQLALSALLQERSWPAALAELVSDAVGCHHGKRATPVALYDLAGNERGCGGDNWVHVRRRLFDGLVQVLKPGAPPTKKTLSGPEFMWLSGLTSFSDWIGSNEKVFTYGSPEDCADLDGWFEARALTAKQALDAIGWSARAPLLTHPRSFFDIFGRTPRPLQETLASVLADVQSPPLLVIEAPMGEGKTEAAFFAHLELQRRFGHRGLYLALPSRATGNAMFTRTLELLHKFSADRTLDLQLLHGASQLNDEFQKIRLSAIDDAGEDGGVRASEWFTHKVRALLSEYGVGTVDQAIVAILSTRHNFVRLWGLANRVVVIDEVHAFDAYTGTLLAHLVRWLLALGSSVVLLSATLSQAVRKTLAEMAGTELQEPEAPYPRISVFGGGRARQVSFAADRSRSQTIRLIGIEPALRAMKSALEARLIGQGSALVLVNTVQRAQELYRLYPAGAPIAHDGQIVGKQLDDGTEVLLFHGRFSAEHRQARENHVLATFGESGSRTGRRILIATQVAEQSLDLDFDIILTDLATIDLLLQRAGRLWRHLRAGRPFDEPMLLVAGLIGDLPPSFGRPLWWDAMYAEDTLLKTWCLLRARTHLSLPTDIDELVRSVESGPLSIPDALLPRLSVATEEAEKERKSYRAQADQASAGNPHDGSWNEAARLVLYDEDEPGIHRSLMAKTRLGKNSLVVIPLFGTDAFDASAAVSPAQAKRLYRRALSLSRNDVVLKLRSSGVSAGWKSSPLLRNAYAMSFDADGRWLLDGNVRLDDELGLVYEQ